MTKKSASHLRAIATAVCAVMLFGACETVRTKERWSKGSIGTSKYERRMDDTVRNTYNQMEALAAGDETADYSHSSFDKKTDVDTKSNLFGKKYADGKTKSFRTKDFAGADEYKSNDYQFLKRQNYKAETSSDQSKRFATDTAPDERKKFFGRNKRARTKDYADANKRARANNYRDTDAELKRLENRRPTIVRDDAQDAGASLMGIDDVRTMLNGSQ